MSKASATTETALAVRQEYSSELAPSSSAAMAEAEIQSAIVLAQRFPRNEDSAFEKLMKSCKRPSFAENVAYSFPRGGQTITGPSVNVAREAARCWGNLRYGLDILRDDDEGRQIRGWAWDLETNVKVTAEDDFKKLVQRKVNGSTQWVKPDERDLRELTNRRGAILVRNCILQILPSDLIEDAMGISGDTLRDKAAKDPEGERKRLVMAFSELNVTPEMLETKLGHKLAQSSPDEIAQLRKVYKSIKDGQSTWHEYATGERRDREQGSLTLDDLKPADEPNRGHGNEGMVQDAVEVAPDARESLLADVQALTEEHSCDGAVLKAYKVKKFSDLTDEQLRAIIAESRDWAK